MPEVVEVTELLEIDPERVDAVSSPANGTEWLILKAIDDVEKSAECDACHGAKGDCKKCLGTGLKPSVGMTAKELTEAAKASDGAAPSGAPVPVRHDCPTCHGTGELAAADAQRPNEDMKCPDCNGTGRDAQYNTGHVEESDHEARGSDGKYSIAHADEGKITEGAGGREFIDKAADDAADDVDAGATCDDEDCDTCKAILESEGTEDDVEKAKLKAKTRNALPDSAFALPGRRYPIHDENHARNALARVAQHGTPAEQAKVKAAVRRRYPNIDVGGAEKSEATDVIVKDGIVSGPNPFRDTADADDTMATGPAPGSSEWEAVDAATATMAATKLMEAAECIRTFAQREVVEVAAGEGNDVFDTFAAESALCGVSQALGIMASLAFHEAQAAAKSLDESEVAEKSGKRLSRKTVGALTALRDHVNNLLGSDDPAVGTVDHDNDDVAAKSILFKEIDNMTGEELIKLLDERDEARRAAKAEKAATKAEADVERAEKADTEAAPETEVATGTEEVAVAEGADAEKAVEDAPAVELTAEEIEANEAAKAAKKEAKRLRKAAEQAAANAATAKAIEEAVAKATEAVNNLKEQLAEAEKANEERLTKTQERLATVEKMAAPSTIVRTPPAEATAKSAERDALELEIARFEAMAKTTSEPDLRRGYNDRAKELRVQLAEKEGKA